MGIARILTGFFLLALAGLKPFYAYAVDTKARDLQVEYGHADERLEAVYEVVLGEHFWDGLRMYLRRQFRKPDNRIAYRGLKVDQDKLVFILGDKNDQERVEPILRNLLGEIAAYRAEAGSFVISLNEDFRKAQNMRETEKYLFMLARHANCLLNASNGVVRPRLVQIPDTNQILLFVNQDAVPFVFSACQHMVEPGIRIKYRANERSLSGSDILDWAIKSESADNYEIVLTLFPWVTSELEDDQIVLAHQGEIVGSVPVEYDRSRHEVRMTISDRAIPKQAFMTFIGKAGNAVLNEADILWDTMK